LHDQVESGLPRRTIPKPLMDAASRRRPAAESELSKTDPQQVSWNVYDCAGKVGRWIGIVEAKSGQAAIRATAKQLGYQRHKLIAIMAASHRQKTL